MAKLNKQTALNWTTILLALALPVLGYIAADIYKKLGSMDTQVEKTDVNARDIAKVEGELKRHKSVIFPITKSNNEKINENSAEITGLKKGKMASEFNREDIKELRALHLK